MIMVYLCLMHYILTGRHTFHEHWNFWHWLIALILMTHFRKCFFKWHWSLNRWKHIEHWNCRVTPHSYLKWRIRLFLFKYVRPQLFRHTQRLSGNNKNLWINQIISILNMILKTLICIQIIIIGSDAVMNKSYNIVTTEQNYNYLINAHDN